MAVKMQKIKKLLNKKAFPQTPEILLLRLCHKSSEKHI